ncbi:hypothetical protein KCP73_15925 [Salmonella enterica subsp. enterica]|nr:hypothetical protein KCP73_15925 [Salmonella enterica subsp. enterica]
MPCALNRGFVALFLLLLMAYCDLVLVKDHGWVMGLCAAFIAWLVLISLSLVAADSAVIVRLISQ